MPTSPPSQAGAAVARRGRPGTTAPGSTTEPPPLASSITRLLAIVVLLWVSGCRSWTPTQRSSGPGGAGTGDRGQPSLSGDGRVLATVLERGGRDTVILQRQPGGQRLPMQQLKRHQPHASPSLSRNGRYLAVVIQRGNRRLAVIADRATGRVHQLTLPGGREPRSLSLDPSGRRIAVELVRNGRSQVELLDLSGQLEPDLAAGQPTRGTPSP